MPVSLDQIVAAFSIMWCMTLKCRTAVPGDSSRTVVRFSYQRADCIAIYLPNERLAQLAPDARKHALFAICRTSSSSRTAVQ